MNKSITSSFQPSPTIGGGLNASVVREWMRRNPSGIAAAKENCKKLINCGMTSALPFNWMALCAQTIMPAKDHVAAAKQVLEILNGGAK